LLIFDSIFLNKFSPHLGDYSDMDNPPATLCSTVLMVTVSTDNAQSLKTSIMTVSSRAKENANRLTISKPPFRLCNGLRLGIAL
jgi:hypothetical protein